MKLWNGRIEHPMDPRAWTMNQSLPVDRRLADQDVRVNRVWARALHRAGVITDSEMATILSGLGTIERELHERRFPFRPEDEDIHTAIERRLTELVGPVAGKIHTGRSRNDQVVTDLRLWMLDHLPVLQHHMHTLLRVLVARAERDIDVIMPGYTHLQQAQPIRMALWWLAHFWAFARDQWVLHTVREIVDVLPLGSGALAGTDVPVDRTFLARELGFSRISSNSLDAVADRDFVTAFLYAGAMIGHHLGRLAADVILFSTREFGFFELPDAFSTGSSALPQKKNPDIFELTRARAARLVELLHGWWTVLHGLPTGYHKDFQEDKVHVFTSYDLLVETLPVVADALTHIRVCPERMHARLDVWLTAVDMTAQLVRLGVPFREAHRRVGQLVRQCMAEGRLPDQIPAAELCKRLRIPRDTGLHWLTPEESVERRNVPGGTARAALQDQIAQAKSLLAEYESRNGAQT